MSYIPLQIPIPSTSGGTGQSSYVTGDVLYASAPNTLSKRSISSALGAPLSTDGVQPIYRDPQKYAYFVDDFIGVVSNQTLGWRAANSSGLISYNGVGGINVTNPSRPGIIVLSTSSNAAGRAIISSYGSGGNSSGPYGLSSGALSCTWDVMLNSLSDANTTYQLWAGLGTGADYSEPTSGAYFSYTDADNSGQWVAKTANASTRTSVNSSIPVVASTWYRLRIDVNATGDEVSFYVNDVLIGSSTTNITANQLGGFVEIVKTGGSVGSAVNQVQVDLFTFYKELSSAR